MIEEQATNALWWVVAAGVFLGWQACVWIVARGRWQRAREAGAIRPQPRFMGEMADTAACFLMDLLPVILTGLLVVAAVAWTMFALLVVGMPLSAVHGPAAGVAGGLLVWGTGSAVGGAVLGRIGERGREARERERARITAQAQAGGGGRPS